MLRDVCCAGLWIELAIAKLNLFAGNGGGAVARNDDSGQIDGVSGGYRDDGVAVAGAGGTERVNGLRKGELLAPEAGDEATATNLSPSFEAAEDAEQVAPFGSVRLAGEEISEEDAIAREEHAGRGFVSGVGAASLLDCGGGGVGLFCEERPATGGAASVAFDGSGGSGGFAAWVHHGAELIEAVRRGETGGGEFPESLLGLGAGEVGDALDVVGEAGSALL